MLVIIAIITIGIILGGLVYYLFFSTPRYSIPGIFVKKIRVKKNKSKLEP